MSLRLKLVLALVAVSATVTIAIGAWSYAVTADRLEAEIDQSLETSMVETVERARRTEPRFPGPPGSFPGLDGNAGAVGDGDGSGDGDRDGDGNGPGLFPGSPLGYAQIVVQLLGGDGAVVFVNQPTEIPVSEDVQELAGAATRPPWIWDEVDVDGEPFRIVAAPLGEGRGALQMARSLAETQRVLDSLRNLTLLAVVAVTTAAAAIGWLIARQITRRLVRLTDVAEQVADTGRLDIAVPVEGHDEAGRLGAAFNEMLSALARSKDAQQRLVQDAGHELRTPLTSLRTNISVLRRHGEMPPATLAHVLDDVDGEARELTDLVNELVELATERRNDEPVEQIELGQLVERMAERGRRRHNRDIRVEADTSTIEGRPQAIERAVTNLIDNAAKFDDSGAPVEVTVRAGRIEVADRGPGIDSDDLPHLFDRFYRAVAMRSRPGSGLGLAIVADVATSHGGTVFAHNRHGGGAVVGFTVPASGTTAGPTDDGSPARP